MLNIKVKKSKHRFWEASKGNVAMITALMFPSMVLILGGAVDLMRFSNVRTEIQGALDSGVLAAASIGNQRPVQTVVAEFLQANIDSDIVDIGDISFTATSTTNAGGRSVVINATTSMQTYFLKLVGIDAMTVNVSAGGRQDWLAVEIALVLDVSGSMANNGRIGNLRTAGQEFIDAIITPDVLDISTISVIPFGSTVRLGDDFRKYIDPSTEDNNHDFNINDGSNWKGCLSIRDSDMNDSAFVLNGEPVMGRFKQGGWKMCPRRRNESVFVSNNATLLKDTIGDLRPGNEYRGQTRMDIGTAIGVKALSPNMRGEYNTVFSGTRPTDYNGETLKALVIMTDGNMTTAYEPLFCTQPNFACVDEGNHTVENMRTKFQELCDFAVDNGIIVYTIGFGINSGSQADSDLMDCVDNANNYYLVENTNIDNAFSAIASSINGARITN